MFSVRRGHRLQFYLSTDCSIEILLGAKLPKSKLHLMTPRELEELQTFIDKNLKYGFIQSVRPRVATPVLFREEDRSLQLYED